LEESCLSEEAVKSQNHAERIASLEKQMGALGRKLFFTTIGWYTSFICFPFGFVLILLAYMGQFELGFIFGTIVELLGVTLFFLSLYVADRYNKQLEPLEKEFADIATPEDWMRRKTPKPPKYEPGEPMIY
jgi:hypothetical protein